jgi:hypothetical protein
MADKKMTKREKYEIAIKMAEENGNDMLVEFFSHEIELLANKSGKSSAKKNTEQETFMDIIRDVLSEAPNPMQCGAIAKDERILGFEWADGKETSPQRVSAMLKKMVDCGDVNKVVDKKITYFSLA